MVLHACHMLLWPAVSSVMLSYTPSVTSGFSNASVVFLVVLVLQDINFWTGLNPLLLGVLRPSSRDIWRSLLPACFAFFTRFFAILTINSAFPWLWLCNGELVVC